MAQVLTNNNDDIDANEVTDATIYALDGNDIVQTTQVSPDLYGGNGGDFLGNQGSSGMYAFGGDGADTIHGGTAIDYIYGEIGRDLLVGGEFNYATAAATGAIVAIEGSGADYLDGGEEEDSLWGFDGADVLLGGDESDTNAISITVQAASPGIFITLPGGLYGGDGDDFLDGGRGNDYLDGGTGADTMLGGTGNDFLFGNDGDDLIITSAPTTLFDGFSIAIGGGGNDRIHALGRDHVLGGFGNDALVATSQYGVAFFGEFDDDSLIGSSVADILDGGAGVDGLSGGLGNDVYTGGAGVDHFVMNNDIRAGDIETITDFAGDFIAMPTVFFGYVGAIDTANGVFVYVPIGSGLWGALVTNTHDAASVLASVYYAG